MHDAFIPLYWCDFFSVSTFLQLIHYICVCFVLFFILYILLFICFRRMQSNLYSHSCRRCLISRVFLSIFFLFFISLLIVFVFFSQCVCCCCLACSCKRKIFQPNWKFLMYTQRSRCVKNALWNEILLDFIYYQRVSHTLNI